MERETIGSLYAALFSQIRRASPTIDKRSIVVLKETDAEGALVSVGSGTLLTEEGYLFTAAHCLHQFARTNTPPHSITAVIGDKEYALEPDYYEHAVSDTALDIALIKARTEGSPTPIRLGTLLKTPDLDEMMFFADPVARKIRSGPVIPFSKFEYQNLRPETHYMIDTPCLAGSSGGPVYTEDGCFAGIVNAVDTTNPFSILAYFTGEEVKGMTGPTVVLRPEAMLRWFADTLSNRTESYKQ